MDFVLNNKESKCHSVSAFVLFAIPFFFFKSLFSLVINNPATRNILEVVNRLILSVCKPMYICRQVGMHVWTYVHNVPVLQFGLLCCIHCTKRINIKLCIRLYLQSPTRR